MNGWDLTLLRHINQEWTNPFLDWLMPVLSAIDIWMPILGLVLIALTVRGGRRARVMLGAIVLAILLSDAVVGNGLKKFFNRPRPRDTISGVMVRDVAKVKPRLLAMFQAPVMTVSKVDKPATGGNSLPSNHTMNLFAVATVVALFFRRCGWPVYLLAFAVAWSRVYVGAHWPSDLPPSMGLGVLVGLIAGSVGLRFAR